MEDKCHSVHSNFVIPDNIEVCDWVYLLYSTATLL